MCGHCPNGWPSRCRRFRDATEQADRLLHLTINGIGREVDAPERVLLLDDVAKFLKEDRDESEVAARLEEARELAEFVRREVDKGFPVLHGQAAVSLWSRLEGLVKSVLAAWLENKPEALQIEAVRNVRLRFGEYTDRSKEEQFEYLVDLLDDDLRSAYRFGVNRLEDLLKPFGLSGEVEDEVGRELFALQQVRHVLVHRGGVADRRLTTNCPWLGVAIGESVIIDHQMYAAMSTAVARYFLALIKRMDKALH